MYLENVWVKDFFVLLVYFKVYTKTPIFPIRLISGQLPVAKKPQNLKICVFF